MVKLKKLVRPGIYSYLTQRRVRYWPIRKRLIKLIASSKPKDAFVKSADVESAIHQLETEGIHFLGGFLSAEQVTEITEFLDGKTLRERFSPFRSGFTINDVPEKVHVAEFDTETILKCPYILDVANNPKLLSIASGYLECKPTISNISIWWSIPDDGSAQEAENYHRDVDDWKFVKFFLYLSDVDERSGPHRFIKKSHRSTKLRQLARLDDQDVIAAFPEDDQLLITGKRGDAFLEDTFGIHKGQPPLDKRRLLLQVEYSINPISVYDYKPIPLTGPKVDGYVNRLYVAPSA